MPDLIPPDYCPEKILSGLNAAQCSAISQIDGPMLILAGPGSGKTRVITHRIAYMIHQGVQPTEIVGLTFTNKAAGEMRQRLENLIGPNKVWLGTFHGFCVRLLRRYARLVGLPENFSIYDTDDATACLKQTVRQTQFDLSHLSLTMLAQKISYFKNCLMDPDMLQAQALSSQEYQVAKVYPYYQQALLTHGAVDFDDLLMHTARMLREYPELREQLDNQFRYMLVDEYQDTNLAQYMILRHLSVTHRNLAATGDPDQSIYGWRGANVTNVASLERDYPDLTLIRLEENYRSTPEILSIADCLIQNNQYRKHKQLVPNRSTGNRVRLTVYSTARDEAEDIAEQIETLVNSGQYVLSDFGILYRTNGQSRLVEQAMLRRNLPYQLIGGFRFYLRKEIKDLIAYLLLVYNPHDNIALQRIINIPPRGIGKQSLQKLQELASNRRCSLLEACHLAVKEKVLSAKATSGLRDFVQLMDKIGQEASGSLAVLMQATIEMTGYREYLRNSKSDDRDDFELQQNIDELLAEAHELDHDTADDRPALERFLEVAALQSDADRMESGQEKVTLMTLHSAKGLEFPWVYLIAVEENILPHARSKDDPLQIEEERRLLFVGITRAKDHLQLSYAKTRGFANIGGTGSASIASSFLMELPRREMSVQDRTDLAETDAYFKDSPPDHHWDDDFVEYGHADSRDEEVAVHVDDDCQLPPEEIRERLLKRTLPKTVRKLATGSDIAGKNVPWGLFRKGVRVSHPQLGSGEIVSATGHGPKRTVTVRFIDTSQERTFRLSHAPLSLES